MEYFLHVVKNPQNCLVLEKIKAHKVFAHKLIFVVYLLYLGKETRTHTHTLRKTENTGHATEIVDLFWVSIVCKIVFDKFITTLQCTHQHHLRWEQGHKLFHPTRFLGWGTVYWICIGVGPTTFAAGCFTLRMHFPCLKLSSSTSNRIKFLYQKKRRKKEEKQKGVLKCKPVRCRTSHISTIIGHHPHDTQP